MIEALLRALNQSLQDLYFANVFVWTAILFFFISKIAFDLIGTLNGDIFSVYENCELTKILVSNYKVLPLVTILNFE